MIERAVILALVSVLVVLAVAAIRLWSARRTERLRADQSDPLWTALGETPDGRPSLVVFSTPGCTACRTVQLPAVETVEAWFGGGLRVLKVDLSRRPAVGEAFKVLTAPTTVVLGGDGRVGSFNHGFAPADRLSAQLSAVGASPTLPR
jgi:thioredoxin-like negative regulator of GroEL